MKAFILKSVFFVVLFFVLEKIFFVFIFNAPSLENDRRLEKVLKGNLNKELYIIGSSRGARNIIASQIKDSLKISCFNLSYPGSNIVFHEFILKAIVKHNKTPKIILLTVDDMVQFFESDVLTFRFERLYPLVYYNYVNDLLIERGEKTFLSLKPDTNLIFFLFVRILFNINFLRIVTSNSLDFLKSLIVYHFLFAYISIWFCLSFLLFLETLKLKFFEIIFLILSNFKLVFITLL